MYWECILKMFLLVGFMIKKFGDHWSKVPHDNHFGMCVFVGFFDLLPFPIGKPLFSHITLYLKH